MPKPGRGGDAQFAEHLFFAVADARGGGLQPFVHRFGGVEQQFALFGQNQPARMAVKQRGVQRFFQRADLAADGGLRQVQRVAGMGQAPASATA